MKLSRDFESELQWLAQVINLRFSLYFNAGENVEQQEIEELEPPSLEDSTYNQVVSAHELNFSERLALSLCLASHLRPRMLDIFFTKNSTFERPFTEFGGIVHDPQSGFLPTGETVLFLLAGSDLSKRLAAIQLLESDRPLFHHRILILESPKAGQSRLQGALRLSPEYESLLIRQKPYRPDFGQNFPAQQLTTAQEWKDLVLPKGTLSQLEEIKLWTEHGDQLLFDWGMHKKFRPGYRSLFYGPPGTGKTMTASLLGKVTGRDVYRIDLSLVVSKFIGETEKNLAKVFDQAEHSNWILFFDEADALFGKRTDVQDAHDRYANQEVSYLLQRLEVFTGIVILASNLKGNLDKAFARRFESMIYFPVPSAEQRLLIWQRGFPPASKAQLEPDLDLEAIAQKYKLAGGAIMNVVRFASLRALANGGIIRQNDVMEGVKREFGKEGRTV